MKNLMILAILALTPTLALANTAMDPLLWGCSEISDDDKRLACFDAYIKQKSSLNAQPVSAPKPLVLNSNGDEPQADEKATDNPDQAQNFGLEHKQKKSADVSEISTTIIKASKQSHSNWVFTFENGQKWRTIESTSTLFKVGQDVVIKRGMFNSFSLKKAGSNRTVKVKRVN
ncbi:hypothetical protein FE810_08135 [Thalassotalea litorea]|uniref:DUF4124 domain-containing protein n=1 Tax=Thalassotalea litorea TaxID=2020715 RepID=A0A5R9ILB4_9GAMM|nr:hypothetical protein [Thalassotalea litorea]TLU65253.1 hypothetical protein FE810_08135 [Thalassotalea litorea]